MSKKGKKPKANLPEELAETRDLIFEKLSELKVTHVTVSWSGGGDSGQVDSVSAKDEKQDVEIELDKSGGVKVNRVYHESVDSGRKRKDGTPIYIQVKKTREEEVNLEEMISTFAEDLWDHFGQGGWYNNDGGFGTMEIDVRNRDMKFEHYNYVQEEHLDVDESL